MEAKGYIIPVNLFFKIAKNVMADTELNELQEYISNFQNNKNIIDVEVKHVFSFISHNLPIRQMTIDFD